MYATRTDDVARKDDVTRIDDVPVQYSVRKRNRADVKNKNGTLVILPDAITFNVLTIADQNTLNLLPKKLFFEEFAEEVSHHLVSDQLTNGLNFLNKEDICTFCFPQERALSN